MRLYRDEATGQQIDMDCAPSTKDALIYLAARNSQWVLDYAIDKVREARAPSMNMLLGMLDEPNRARFFAIRAAMEDE